METGMFMECMVKTEAEEDNGYLALEATSYFQEEQQGKGVGEYAESSSVEYRRPLLVLLPQFEEGEEAEDNVKEGGAKEQVEEITEGDNAQTRGMSGADYSGLTDSGTCVGNRRKMEHRTVEEPVVCSHSPKRLRMRVASVRSPPIGSCKSQSTNVTENVQNNLHKDILMAKDIDIDDRPSKCGLCKSAYVSSEYWSLHDHNYAQALLFCSCVTNLSAHSGLDRRKEFSAICSDEEEELEVAYLECEKPLLVLVPQFEEELEEEEQGDVHDNKKQQEMKTGENDCVEDAREEYIVPDALMEEEQCARPGPWHCNNPPRTVQQMLDSSGVSQIPLSKAPNDSEEGIHKCASSSHNCHQHIEEQTTLSAAHDLARIKILACIVCEKSFTVSENLQRHMKEHEGQSSPLNQKQMKFACSICKKLFPDLDGLLQHMKEHTDQFSPHKLDQIRFTCNICKKLFPDIENLYHHVKEHTHQSTSQSPDGLKTWVCSICETLFPNSNVLHQHMKEHTRQNSSHNLCRRTTLFCKVCKKLFKDADVLHQHMKEHADQITPRSPQRLFFQNAWVCSVCNKMYAKSVNFQQHMKQHVDQPSNPKKSSWFCSICKKYFADSVSSILHMKKHTDMSALLTCYEGKVLCSVCKHFIGADSYLQHLDEHSTPSVQQNVSLVRQYSNRRKINF